MGIEILKTFERKVRRFVRRKKYAYLNLPPDEEFYWYVSHYFTSILGEGRLAITMPPGESGAVLVSDIQTGVKMRLSSESKYGQTELDRHDGIKWNKIGKFESREAAILRSVKIQVAEMLSHASDAQHSELDQQVESVPLENGGAVPPMLNLGEQWTTALHRSGWGYALDPLKSLHTPNGVIFDGFLESTFCWKDTGMEYLKPWVGVIHNPPQTPKWANGGTATNEYMFKTERWARSRKNCKGIFVLSECHKQALENHVNVPISVIRHPTESPQRKFSWADFKANPQPKLVQVGHWLRNPNSLYKLNTKKLTKSRLDVGHPWEEQARRHFPTERLDLDSVELIPRLDNDDYDELLATNIVFLDLLDSSANNAIIECIVRNTPLLVNRIAPVVEYLGEDYPLYFESLDEASSKADDLELLQKTHEYLRKLPKEQYTQATFLNSIVTSDVYQSLLPSTLEKTILFAHARSGSSTLHNILNAHDDIRMSYEPFNPKRANWNQFDYRSLVTDESSLTETVDEIFGYHNGMKHLFYQLDEKLNESLLRRNCRRIFLTRRNLLQATVSGMIADQTKRWAGNRREILKARLEPLDITEISNRIRWISNSIQHYRDFMKNNGLDFLEVRYEDLFGENISTFEKIQQIGQIFEHLGTKLPTGQPRERILDLINPESGKINSALTYQRIPNVEKLERELGNSSTGYLFPAANENGLSAAIGAA